VSGPAAASQGLLDPSLDPGQLLLSMMALTAYPVVPQLARLATACRFPTKNFKNTGNIPAPDAICCRAKAGS